MYRKLLRKVSENLNITDQLLITYSAIITTCERKLKYTVGREEFPQATVTDRQKMK